MFSNNTHYKLLLLGYPGKTTFVYWLKLNKSVEVNKTTEIERNSFSSPLNKHILYETIELGSENKIGKESIKELSKNVNAVIYFLPTQTRENLNKALIEAKEVVYLRDLSNVPIVFFCVVRDIGDLVDISEKNDNVLTEKEISHLIINSFKYLNDRAYTIIFGVSSLEFIKKTKESNKTKNNDNKYTINDGNTNLNNCHIKLFSWLETILKNKGSNLIKVTEKTNSKYKFVNSFEQKFIQSFYSVSDSLCDKELITKLEEFNLPSWDHKTHLRVAFVLLKCYGRKEGMIKICDLLKNYISKASNTNGKTYHETLTVFWSHMLWLAISQFPDEINFDEVLYQCPWLLNGFIITEFYDKDYIFKSPEPREKFVLPTLKTLPDILI
jgi:hypothetical protein